MTDFIAECEKTMKLDETIEAQTRQLALNDPIVRLYVIAQKILMMAQEIADEDGEGTVEQIEAETEAKHILEACAEIHRLRQSDGRVILTILANTPPDEWLSKAAIHDALQEWRS